MAGGATFLYNRTPGPVAQSVEQRIENPCVGGSIPPQATSINPIAQLFSVGRFHLCYPQCSGPYSILRVPGP